MAPREKTKPKLPWQQLAILGVVRFSEPVALTSVFPYLPEMIQSFGVKRDDVAKWAGLTSAMFSIAQSITAVPWGWTSDKIGRKPTIIVGLLCSMTCFLFWGMSTTLAMAITVRGIHGCSNGNVGIIRTMVAEMVPEKELQPRAFSIMPMIWSVGSVFGPSFGGFFARPAEQYPKLFGNSRFLKKYPFVLPNLIAFVIFVLSVTTATLFLHETLETRKDRTDWGLELGDRIKQLFGGKPSHRTRRRALARERQRNLRRNGLDIESSAPLLDEADHDVEDEDGNDGQQHGRVRGLSIGRDMPSSSSHPTPKLTSVHAHIFTYQTGMALLCYSLLALHAVSYDQILSVFLNYPPENHRTPENTRLPFRFNGGFGLSSGRIGTIFTINALVSGFGQFVVFPPLCHRFGTLRCFRAACLVYPFLYLITPYTVLVENVHLRYAFFLATLFIKGFLGILTFPCITILLTNSAPSLKVLGTLNGFATTFSGVGRASGPAMTGAIFSAGVQRGYIIAGWWFLSFVSVIGAVAALFLGEGKGIQREGGEEERDDDEEYEDEDEELENEGANRDVRNGDYYDDDNEYEEALLEDTSLLPPATTTTTTTTLRLDIPEPEDPDPYVVDESLNETSTAAVLDYDLPPSPAHKHGRRLSNASHHSAKGAVTATAAEQQGQSSEQGQEQEQEQPEPAAPVRLRRMSATGVDLEGPAADARQDAAKGWMHWRPHWGNKNDD